MKHLMIDIETMSNHSSEALTLSLGALPFDLKREGPEFGKGLMFLFDAGPQLLTRHVSRKTQDWWKKQSREAQRHWTSPGVATIHPAKLESYLRKFISEFTLVCEVEIWANGDRFDVGNLENLMFGYDSDKEFDDVVPWRYNAVSDCRTMFRWTPKLRTMPADLKFESHDPMEDCKKQIWRLWECASDLLLNVEIAQPSPQPAVTLTFGSAIPNNVTWDDENGNFYDAVTSVGKGQNFYDQWKNRKDEFPKTPKIVVHPTS